MPCAYESERQLPSQSPLYHALHSDRYDRQQAISEYQNKFACKLVVMRDAIFSRSVVRFEDLIYDASPETDLHVILASPGGSGETAVRLVRAAQARCKELTIIVPDQAKSAATLMALGAHCILMSATSDLGPIDSQFPHGDELVLVSAKDIIAAVDDAAQKVQDAPNTFPIYASLLADVNALMVQQARSSLARNQDQLEEALKSNPDRSDDEVRKLKDTLIELLIDRPRSHSALFSAQDAINAGLPVKYADPRGEQWQMIWRLWTKYYALGTSIYEGERASHLTSR